MFYRIYRFLSSTSELIEGLFDEMACSEVADCEQLILKRLFFEEDGCEGSAYVVEWCGNDFFNLRSTQDIAMTNLYV